MKEVGHYPLLDAETERELATLIKQAKAAQRRLQQNDPLSWRERARLKTAVARGHSARERMIQSNLRLVIKLIGKYAHCGLPFGDLVQEGNIGLMRAVERFDPQRGVRFATYAGWWIKQSVLRALANYGRTIRRPPWLVHAMGQLRQARTTLEARLARTPTDAELAQQLRWTVPRVRQIGGYDQPELSLDMAVDGSEECPLGELLADQDAPAPHETVLRHLACEHVRAAIDAHLDPRAQAVLRLRYGLDGGAHRTLGQIGAELGITAERVRQIEKSAMRQLRRAIVQEEM
jgi:RNA polymerase sigma factor (sigma-70 family)